MTHILLVEDNPIDARLFYRSFAEFKEWPTELMWIDDGQKALWFLKALEEGEAGTRPNLVLMDLNLPKYDGLQVMEVFRQSAKAWDIPIFLMSSAPAEEIAAIAAKNHIQADGYFEKPCGIDQFAKMVQGIRAHSQGLFSSFAHA